MLPLARAVVAGLLAAGACLRLWQYAANASLWADEANMALNLVSRSWARLLEPLDHRQVAAPGWLLLEKAVLGVLGDGELALRLVPFLGSLVALPLFAALAGRLLRGLEVPLAVALVALGIPFILYAAQLKPYGSDLAATLALTLAVLPGGVASPERRALRLGLGGAVAVWFSQAAVLVVASLSVALCLLAAGDRSRRSPGPVVIRLLPALLSAGLAVLEARRRLTAADVAYLQRFWESAFLPVPPRSLRDLAWPLTRLNTAFGGGAMAYPLPGLFLGLALLGGRDLWRRDRPALLLLVAPFAITLAASTLRLYPFAPRTVLFLFPAALLLVAAGTSAVARLARGWERRAALGTAALCAALAVLALLRYPPPYRPEDLKPVLAAVQRERQPGDAVYVYYGGDKAFRYYAGRFGFRPGDYVMGGCWRDDPRAFLRELDRFRGQARLWVIITHALPELREDTLILGYLDRIGVRQAAHEGAPPARGGRAARAAAYRYDLTDPARLGSASAGSYPLGDRSPGGDRAWSC